MASTWKSPADVFDYALQFSSQLQDGEEIDSIISVTSSLQPGGTDSTNEIIAQVPTPEIDGSIVRFWLQGGTLGERHLILVEIETDQSRRFTGSVNLDILEL